MSRAAKRHRRKLQRKTAKGKGKGHAQSSLILAQQHHLAGKLSQAETVYNEILKAEPNNPDALHLLGALCHQSGNVENAIELILKALAGHPNFPEAYNNLGNAYKKRRYFSRRVVK